MAAYSPHHSSHDNDSTHFVRDGLDTPPTDSLAATPQIDSPFSQSRSCSSSLIHSEHPRSQPLSIKPNPKSEQSREKSELLAGTSKARDYPFRILSTRYFGPAIVLQNSGSVARDHLASERTFLAYVRTSLGLASAGVAFVQLFTMSNLVSESTGVRLPAVNQRLQQFSTGLGLSALGMALIVLFIGKFLLIFFFQMSRFQTLSIFFKRCF